MYPNTRYIRDLFKGFNVYKVCENRENNSHQSQKPLVSQNNIFSSMGDGKSVPSIVYP